MDTPTITVEHDGQTLTVPATAVTLPEGAGFYGGDFGDPDGYKRADAFETALDERARSIVSKRGLLDPKDAESDDFFKRLAKKRGIELGDDLKPVAQLDPEKLKHYRQTWADEELAPVLSEAEQVKAENAALREENLLASLSNGLRTELKPDAFKPIVPGVPSAFEAAATRLIKRDDEGKPYFEGEGGIPDYDYQKAFLKHLSRHAPDLMQDHRNGSSGFSDKGGAANGRVYTRQQFDAMPDAQRAEIAARAGRGEVSITD